MALFSERYGYVKPRDILVREHVSQEIKNAVCSAYDMLDSELNHIDVNRGKCHNHSYGALELSIWMNFLNRRRNDYYEVDENIVVAYILGYNDSVWFRVLDLVEYTLKWMSSNFQDRDRCQAYSEFIQYLNHRFEALGFAYRIVNNEIVEITSEEEIVEVEQAITVDEAITQHISTALRLISQRPDPDYRNSIKESISAVEYICRQITGKSTLGDAFKELEKNGVELPSMIKSSFEKLYNYTNDKATGIRHALMDEKNAPGFEEAKFMLVACSAFVNYMKAKSK